MTPTTEYTDRQIIDAIEQHITARLDYLARLTYHHEANIAQPDADEQYDYLTALGEQMALHAIQRILAGGSA